MELRWWWVLLCWVELGGQRWSTLRRVVYEGEFVKGHFHGEGKLVYPNVRVWRGREVSTRRGGKRAK